jgi:Cu+-exporting ATPase
MAGDRAVYTCPMHPRIRAAAPGACPICGMTLMPAPGAIGRLKPVVAGALACAVMLGIYFGVLGALSGWDFALSEFSHYWYFVLALALGFGVQVGLYTYLRQRLTHHYAGRVVAATGTTSTLAMISCCSHYLANMLPVIGAAGLVTLIAQYQVELFWVGLAFNVAGILFIARRIRLAERHA